MNQDPTNQEQQPVMGIGACLAGRAVRYNGQTKAANDHVQRIAEIFAMRPFCPEMAAGLGVPRPPIHLVGDQTAVRVLDVESHQHDHTDAIARHAREVLTLEPNLCGYVLVKASPSCGYERVKRFNQKGNIVAHDQQGIFAAALGRADPLLPLEDDGRLNDPGLRESFVTRALVYHNWKRLNKEGLTAARLIEFYSRHKYLVMAHHHGSYKRLGPLLANAGKQALQPLAGEFIATLMDALKHRATRRSHSNALFHLSGYLKKKISPEERQRLKALIDQYRLGQVPLIVPVTLLRHHFANNPNAYIDQQVFLEPFPDSLQLRNVV
jgi:uncharacterized protein YbgA (DUF1722 family)/uncharacterized protein YbbK (DUF523 family)